MARTVISVNELTRDGLADPAETAGDVTNGNTAVNDGKTFVRVRNADGTTARTATFVTPGTVDSLAIADRVISVPLSSTVWVGPFPQSFYGGSLDIDSETADLNYTVFSLPLN